MKSIEQILKTYTETHDNGGNYIDMNGGNAELKKELNDSCDYRLLCVKWEEVLASSNFALSDESREVSIMRYYMKKWNLKESEIINCKIVGFHFMAHIEVEALLKNLSL
jgi:hypothetical protein